MQDIALRFGRDLEKNDETVQRFIHQHYHMPKVDKVFHVQQMLKKNDRIETI